MAPKSCHSQEEAETAEALVEEAKVSLEEEDERCEMDGHIFSIGGRSLGWMGTNGTHTRPQQVQFLPEW